MKLDETIVENTASIYRILSTLRRAFSSVSCRAVCGEQSYNHCNNDVTLVGYHHWQRLQTGGLTDRQMNLQTDIRTHSVDDDKEEAQGSNK